MEYYIFAILIVAGLVMIYYLLEEMNERIFLKKILNSIIEKTQIDNTDDLVKIKNYLLTTITYNGELKNKRRPILRSTASDTLKNHYGFCGENSRVAIKLMIIGGMNARRIYLFRRTWQHVLVEHEMKGNWYMFDGHYDVHTLLEDNDIGKIPSEDIASFPNNYPNNPYLDFCRIKFFKKLIPIKSLSLIKLPKPIVYFFESPYLIKATAALMLELAGIILLFTLV